MGTSPPAGGPTFDETSLFNFRTLVCCGTSYLQFLVESRTHTTILSRVYFPTFRLFSCPISRIVRVLISPPVA